MYCAHVYVYVYVYVCVCMYACTKIEASTFIRHASSAIIDLELDKP